MIESDAPTIAPGEREHLVARLRHRIVRRSRRREGIRGVSAPDGGEAATGESCPGAQSPALAIRLSPAPAAAIVWYIFHGVYEDLRHIGEGRGYVDGMTQARIDFGYAVIGSATLILAVVASGPRINIFGC